MYSKKYKQYLTIIDHPHTVLLIDIVKTNNIQLQYRNKKKIFGQKNHLNSPLILFF